MKALLCYGLSIGGLGFIIAAVLGAYAINVSYPAGRLRMLSALRMSVNQAEMMCKAAAHSWYEPIGTAIKTAAMLPPGMELDMIGMTTRPGYDSSVGLVKLHWKKLFGRGRKGITLVLLGLTAAIATKTTPTFHILVAIAALGAGIWFSITRADNERSLLRARADVLPELDRAFYEGRYTQTLR